MVKDDQRSTGVLPGHIDLLVDHGIAGDDRRNVGLGLYLKPFLLQVLHGHCRKNMLFGKALGRENQRRGERLAGEERGGAQRRQAGKQSHKSSLL